MKILLINNNTRHLKSLSQSLVGHDIEMQMYEPGLKFNDHDKDLVILSGGGGEGLEIYDKLKRGQLWYEDQMKYVLSSDKPIVGICMGFEVIASAYGEKIHETSILTTGFHNVTTTQKGRKFFNRNQLQQFESHFWQLRSAPKDFDILADSSTGIELIRHKNKLIFATQFHPEKGGTLHLQQLLRQAY